MGESFELNYDAIILLDAENLAEGGIGSAYAQLQQELQRHGATPEPIVEEFDHVRGGRYVVRCGGEVFVAYDDDVTADDCWGQATYIFFAIVNRQLSASTHRFYAINGGNELAGFFLTPAQAAQACRSLTSKADWPYIPSPEPPWFGQPHD
jgi:hypothetical protein